MPAPIADILSKVMAAMPASWRTSSAGYFVLAMVGYMIYEANKHGKPIDVEQMLILAGMGLGLINARDNKVSSEEAGAKPKAP